ncbi:amino acid adenylation domain-containing protein [Chryseobacterium rhizoplanae]|uniref:Amino acid adenylation domain-containing protein n=1 Tax=Chryseobacterium rhizoplanae TaxID=1609531 RepID=A0A521EI06_9FLAO|nr:non-ribosomal peptide synthetase [Chryseobacterium rhizoplanae]SMO83546.1 amino acid adenylation domain-containing protein [Chryseobacterium rhizoplanae]
MNTLSGYRISPQQSRFLTVYNHTEKLNSQLAFTCDENIDTDKLKNAITSFFDSDIIFKTTYHQITEPSNALQIPGNKTLIEFLDHPEVISSDEAISGLLSDEINREINISEGPLIWVKLVRLQIKQLLVSITLPAITADLRTLEIIAEKIFRFYENGAEVKKEEALSYLQFAEWQNQLLEEEETQESLKYWRNKKISGLNQFLTFDQDIDSKKEFVSASHVLDIKNNSLALLKKNFPDYSSEEILFACWNLLLWRQLETTDFISGYVHSFREYEELQSLCGCCCRTLPFHLEWDKTWLFKDVLRQTKQEIETISNNKEAFEHHVFFKGETKPNKSYTIPYSFEYAETSSTAILKSQHFAVIQAVSFTENIKLKLVCKQVNETISVELQYNANAFRKETVLFLADAFENILNKFISEPVKPILQVSLLSDLYKTKLLKEFNQTSEPQHSFDTVCQLFDHVVTTFPAHVAVVARENQLSYQQLDQKATQLGLYLKEVYGIKAGDLVGVMFGKNENLMIALMAVIKSGGGFVPIDPANPEERINFILKDSAVTILLSETAFEERTALLQIPTLAIDSISEFITTKATLHQRTAEDILYVIYTSGTTGNPKGTIIQDKALLNYVSWFTDSFNINATDSSILLGSYAFDLGYTSIWGTLLNGGSLHLVDDEMVKNPDSLIDYLTENTITFIKTTPSLFHTLTASIQCNNLAKSNLRLILLGGEPIRPKDLEKIIEIKPEINLVNHYGPTESTIGTIAYKIDNTQMAEYAMCPVIGNPISNNSIYIVDEHGSLVAPGIDGEIMISGKGLAAGYLKREDLTSEKFLADPFTQGQKMYKTGDIARWMPDGTILFRGRRDDQVKIRGYRVELEEIQKVIQSLSGIDHVLIIPRRSEDYGLELAAYFVSQDKIDTVELRMALLETLPDYMVPSYFVSLDKFPLTANGKVDKKALPDPTLLKTESKHTAPRTKLEKSLAVIWEEILEYENIGVYDDFFTIGGHSLKAINLVTQLSKKLDIKIKLQDVFIYSTIEKLAAFLHENGVVKFAPIPVLASQPYYDLSHSQRRLWILDQLENDQVAYNVPAACIIEGKLNAQAFSKAFVKVTERHESLRTTFITVNGEPKQQIHAPGELSFEVRNIDFQTAPNKREKAQKFVEAEADTPFNLEKGPLLRAHLLQLEPEKYVFVFNMHHIISDGWSIGVLIEEVLTLYHAFSRDEENPLPALTIQYKDFASWQNQKLQDEEVKQAQAYWWGIFKDEIPILEFPGDYSRPAIQTYNGAQVNLLLDRTFSERLVQFSKEQSTTLFITLLSSINALLYHYTDQEDIVIGTPVAGREHPDLDNQIGFYVNTLPVRSRFNATESFEMLVRGVKENMLKAQEHQIYPFDRLVDDLNLETDLSRSALFDVMVSLSNPDTAAKQFEKFKDIQVSEFTIPSTISKFDLSFDFQEMKDGIKVSIEYNTDLFKPSRMERMLRHYQKMLSEILQNTKAPLNEIDILSSAEVKQLLEDFNDTITSYDTEKTIVDMFYDQVEKYPDTIAVSFGSKLITYAELNEQSNRLAHYLSAQLLLSPDLRIGLLMNRSEKMLVSVLAVLKMGAAYVPIDTEYPLDRIEYLIQESGAHILITDSAETVSNLSVSVKVIDLYAVQNEVADCISGNLTNQIHPDNPAYIIFTSGSTGNPKGVIVNHRNLSNIANSWRDGYKLHEFSPNLLQLASISFDVFIGDFCRCLLNGGKMVICPGDFRGDPIALYEIIHEHQINILETTPGIILPLMRYIQENNLDISFMKLLILGSDTCLIEDFKWLLNSFSGHMRIINSYGTTETTIDSSYFESSLGLLPKEGNVPIGKPMHNTSYFILNNNKKLVPVGVIGELYIGGAGVSNGYLNRNELNEERFIKLPEVIHSQKVYKTGDRACWLPDGNVAFYGRNDNQIKIRGYRIELGEIENILLQHPAIKSVAVLAKPDQDGHNRLIAYCSLNNVEAIANIKESIKKRLPEYMLPSFFLILDELPLTPNGKINHKALPNPDINDLRNQKGFSAPVTETQKKLATIWERILKIETIGKDDHFFEMGGHSLKATQVITQVHKEFGISIQLRDLFMNPVLFDLAYVIDAKEKTVYEKIEQIADADYYPLSVAQNRLWIQDQMQEGLAAYNITDAFEMDGRLSLPNFEKAYKEVINRHESLRTTFIVHQGEPRQIIHDVDSKEFSITYKDLRDKHASTELVQLMVDEESTAIFDLEKGPLIKASLLRLTDENQVFVLTMHHIVSDGWSSNVFLTELMKLYHAGINGLQNPLPALTMQYKDYAVWHRNLLSGINLKTLKNYWCNQFAGEIQILNLLTDNPRPEVKTYNGSTTAIDFGEALSEQLQSFSKQHSLSIYMTLLGVIKVLLHKYTGQEDIIIGSPISGRVHSDLDAQIGFYVNSLALRSNLDPNQSIADYFQSIKKTVLDAEIHQLYPFESLVEDLKLEYMPNRSPITDVWMQLYNQEVEANSEVLGGLKVKEFQINHAFSKNDLTFNFVNNAGLISLITNYNTDLFEIDTISKMQDDLIVLTDKLIQNTGLKLSEIELVAKNESTAFMEAMFNL